MNTKIICSLLLVIVLCFTFTAFANPQPPSPCTTPGAFSLTGPNNNSCQPTSGVALSWGTSTDADHYQVYLDTFTPPTTYQANITAPVTTWSSGVLESGKTYYWKIVAYHSGSCTTSYMASTQTFSFTTPPGKATTPSPATGATNVGITTDLSWSPGSGATSHDVYFGTSSPGTLQGNQTATTFDTGTMSNNTTYYWRIDEKNACGTTTGDVWSCTTIVAAPGQATSPSPANAATGVSTTATLSWTAGSGATSHDVYFGTTSPGMFIGNQTGMTYNPGTMANSKTYYWRIDEKNAGGTTTGTVWSFTTARPVVPNVVGMTQAAATAAITAVDNLTVGTVTQQYSNTVAAGSVISQSPVGGTQVDIGSTVNITVSLGRPVVPNVVGMTQAAATAAITAVDNLTVGTVTQQYSNTVAAGSVISQSPASGTEVNIGSSVDLVISLSRPPAPTLQDPILDNGSVQLSWTYNQTADFNHYNVCRAEVNGGPYIIIADDVTSKNYTDNVSSANTQSKTYYYVVTAVNEGANESSYSNQKSATLTFYVRNLNRNRWYATIQSAISAAFDNETIQVSAGTYTENLVFTDKKITLTSDDPLKPNLTIIEAKNAGNVITFNTGAAASTIRGFTLGKGSGFATSRGIYCDGASPTILNCVIYGNHSSSDGAGVYVSNSSVTLIETNINRNETTGKGGAIYGGTNANILVKDCVITDNRATSGGGAIYGCSAQSQILRTKITNNYSTNSGAGAITDSCSTIHNSFIRGNRGQSQATALYNCDGDIINCTIVDNTGASNLAGLDGCNGKIENTIIYNNGTGETAAEITNYTSGNVKYCCIKGWTGSDTNIHPDDPMLSGYLLQTDSPCINKGNPAYILDKDETDIDGQRRLCSTAVDIGAYEYGKVIYVDAHAPEYAEFDGESGYITVQDDSLETKSVLNFGTEDFSICFWIKFGNDFVNAVMEKEEYGEVGIGGYKIGFFFGGHGPVYDFLYASFNDGTHGIGGNAFQYLINDFINDDIWHFVAYSIDRHGQAVFYFDGFPVSSVDGTVCQNNISNNADLKIGMNTDLSNIFDGSLDDIRIYKKALSQTEIAAIYNNGTGTLCSDSSFAAVDGFYMNFDTLFNGTTVYGRKVVDGTSEALNGTITTGVTQVAGGIPITPEYGQMGGSDNDKYAQFGGSTGYVSVPFDAGNQWSDFGTDDFSISIWVKIHSWVDGYMTGLQTTFASTEEAGISFNSGWRIGINSVKYFSITVNNINSDCSFPFSYDVWYHLVWAMDRDGQSKLYINAVPYNISATSTGAASSHSDTLIGTGLAEQETGIFFDGNIDNLQIFKGTLLTSEEVATLYNGGSGCKYDASQAGAASAVFEFDDYNPSDPTHTYDSINNLQGTLSGTVSLVAGGVPYEGSSWATAYKYLQDALTSADLEYGDEIWVADGTYYPDEGTGQTDNARTSTFQLVEGVAVYGGFASGETELQQRNWSVNKTILSGDIDDESDNDANDNILTGNSYHVITAANNTLLDGFTIKDGYAETAAAVGGGGVYCSNASPVIANCNIISNYTKYGQHGGGIYASGTSSPRLINCLVCGNFAEGNRGGGIYQCGTGTLELINCTVANNVGDGIHCDGASLDVNNCIVWQNRLDVNDTTNYSIREIVLLNDAQGTISYSNIESGQSGVKEEGSPVGDLNWGTGNSSQDPNFVQWGRWEWHLADGNNITEGVTTINSVDDLNDTNNVRVYDFLSGKASMGKGMPGVTENDLVLPYLHTNPADTVYYKTPQFDGNSTNKNTLSNDSDFDAWWTTVGYENKGPKRSCQVPWVCKNAGKGIFQFNSEHFFPIDDSTYSANDNKNEECNSPSYWHGVSGPITHNYFFTLQYHGKYTYVPGEKLFFKASDDLVIAINNRVIVARNGLYQIDNQGQGGPSRTTVWLKNGNAYIYKDPPANPYDIDSLTPTTTITDVATGGLQSFASYDFDLFFANRDTMLSKLVVERTPGEAELIASFTDGNYHLQSGSPCIDAGDNDAVPLTVNTDLDCIYRFIDDPNTVDTGAPPGDAPFIDMGAYEYEPNGSYVPIDAYAGVAKLTTLPDDTEVLWDATVSGGYPQLTNVQWTVKHKPFGCEVDFNPLTLGTFEQTSSEFNPEVRFIVDERLFATQGYARFVLAINAADGVSRDDDEVLVMVYPGGMQNQPPYVYAGVYPAVDVGQQLRLEQAEVSDDGLPNGQLDYGWEVVSYPTNPRGSWEFDETYNANTLQARITFGQPGKYRLRLWASDGEKDTNAFTDVNVIGQPNTRPVAEAGEPDYVNTLTIDDFPLQLNLKTICTTSSSYVADDGSPTITWSVVSNNAAYVTFANRTPAALPESPRADVNVTFRHPGVYILKLTADDGQGPVSDYVTITLSSAPELDAGQNKLRDVNTPLLEVDTNDSWARDNTIPEQLSYLWEIDEINKPTGATVTFKNEGATSTQLHPTVLITGADVNNIKGPYRLVLTVTDVSSGLQASDSVWVTIVNKPPELPQEALAFYAGVSNIDGTGDVYRRLVTSPSWVRISTEGTFNGPVLALCNYNGIVYAGTKAGASVAGVWKCNGGASWTKETNDVWVEDQGISQFHALIAYNGKLYAGTNVPNKLFKYESNLWSAIVVTGHSSGIGSLYVWKNKLFLDAGKTGELGYFDSTCDCWVEAP